MAVRLLAVGARPDAGVTAELPEGLRRAVRQVELDNPPALSITSHPASFTMLAEMYAKREKAAQNAQSSDAAPLMPARLVGIVRAAA